MVINMRHKPLFVLAAAFTVSTMGEAASNLSLQSTMLFLDASYWFNSSDGVVLSIGTPYLLSTYRDPSSYVGWGYPSVWKHCEGVSVCDYRMIYQGRHLSQGTVDKQLMLMATSSDGVHWVPASFTNRSGCGCPTDAPNCVMEINAEFSVVYDDSKFSPDAPLKMLFENASVSTSSHDGTTWNLSGNWTSTKIDPGISVFRNPEQPEEVVVTARPQALRSSDGRHAGYHSGMGWAALAQSENIQALPLDNIYSPTDQMYGLPSFSYGGMVVSYLWRYRCPEFPCYKGGFVSVALAYSHNSKNWTAFGQPDADMATQRYLHRDAQANPVVPQGPLNNTDIGYPAYYRTYKHFDNATEGALACQDECNADPQCAAYTYVVGDTCCGVERCCRHARLGCPVKRDGCVSGAKVPKPCINPSPPSPLPPPPPPPPAKIKLPELFPNVNGSLYEGQIYPNTLIEMEDRILIHSSASTHQHGFVSKTPATWSSMLTFELRKDGFTYIATKPGKAKAQVLTKPLMWQSGELVLNADCDAPGAVVKVAICSETGAEIRGYEMFSSLGFTGNTTSHTVSWNSGALMSKLAGKTVMVSVELTGAAKVFSFRGNFSYPV